MVCGFNEKNLAVVILCKERLKYLVYTWSSLMKVLNINCPIYVYDDGSQDKDLNQFLTYDKWFALRKEININCEVLSRCVGYFQPKFCVEGIATKIVLRKQPKSIMNTAITFKYMREIFDENPNVQYILRIEDDVVFKENGLDILFESWNKWNKEIINPGILCGCAIGVKREPTSYIVTNGFPSAQCVLLSRDFYKIDKEAFKGPWKCHNKADLYLDRYCRDFGLICGSLGTSICQHIGIESEELKTHNDDYYSKSYAFDRRIDYTVSPPYVL
jgi:hypothetical protein